MKLAQIQRVLREKPFAPHAIGAATFLLLTLALYVTTLLPMQRDGVAVERLHGQLADQQRRQEMMHRSRNALAAQLDKARLDLAATPLEFSSPRAVNEQLARLAELASWSGLTIETIDPGRVTTGPMLATQPIRVTGRGSFAACHGFMQLLRAETPETSVSTFALSADATGALRFEMDLLWYSRPDATSPAVTASADGRQ